MNENELAHEFDRLPDDPVARQRRREFDEALSRALRNPSDTIARAQARQGIRASLISLQLQETRIAAIRVKIAALRTDLNDLLEKCEGIRIEPPATTAKEKAEKPASSVAELFERMIAS